jgi:hypothetical protein
MKIEISKLAADAMVDSLEYALKTLEEIHASDELDDVYRLAQLRTAIENLQMIRVSYMLASRNAAKEQREGRANTQSGRVYDKTELWTKDQHDAQG